MKHDLLNDPEVQRMAAIGAQYCVERLAEKLAGATTGWNIATVGKLIEAKPKRKRTLSPEGRAAIAAAAKRRWAKARVSARRTRKETK